MSNTNPSVPSENFAPEFNKNGGRIFRRRESGETDRVVTVAYVRKDNKIHYGASIFRKDSTSDNFVKRSHNNTAVGRCRVRPVVIDDQDFEHPAQRDEYIRQALYKRGVSGPRN